MLSYSIKNNPNRDTYKLVSEAIAKNDGYCCCAVQHTPDKLCMCKDFQEQAAPGFCHCGRYYKIRNAETVVLCGSTRFVDKFHEINRKLTLEGYIVLAPGVYGHASKEPPSEQEKAALDELHFLKIEKADWVYVLNVGGYIGESTRREIEWAEELGKPIKYLEE